MSIADFTPPGDTPVVDSLGKLTPKQFDDQIASLTAALRAEIEAAESDLDSSPAAIAARRTRVLNGDFQYFCYTYFPHHIWGNPSEFQSDIMRTAAQILFSPSGSKDWWVAPRGEAKSTIATKLLPLYANVCMLLQQPAVRQQVGWRGDPPPAIDYILLLGAETRLPTKLLAVIKTELENNAALAMDFPEACGRTSDWRQGDIITRLNVRIEPFGAEQAVRGTFHGSARPKLLLGDDLITDKEAKSETERNNRWDWLEKAIDYLGPPDGTVKYIGVGTVLHKDDPISRAKKAIGHLVHHFRALITEPINKALWERCEELMRNDDKPAELAAQKNGERLEPDQLPSYQFYLQNRRAMDKGATWSWPQVRTLYGLMRARAKNRRAFATEMQGDPRSDDDVVFNNIQFWVHNPRRWVHFGGCDPSMGKGKSSDPSALIVGGWDTEKHQLCVIEAVMKRRLPSKLLSDLANMQQEFNCVAWGFENNTAFEHMRGTFITDALRLYKVRLPLVGMTASLPMEVCIDQLEPFINNGLGAQILFHAGLIQLLDQLDSWPESPTGHHYDGLIALYILWVTASSRAGGIPGVLSAPRRRQTIRY